jgi:hypothetical protein
VETSDSVCVLWGEEAGKAEIVAISPPRLSRAAVTAASEFVAIGGDAEAWDERPPLDGCLLSWEGRRGSGGGDESVLWRPSKW